MNQKSFKNGETLTSAATSLHQQLEKKARGSSEEERAGEANCLFNGKNRHGSKFKNHEVKRAQIAFSRLNDQREWKRIFG